MLSINISELVLTILSFFLLFFLLKRFLYTPLINFMDDRRARIEAGLDQEKQALAAVEENERLLDEKRRESMDEAKRIAQRAQGADRQRREKLVEQARREADQSRSKAETAAIELQKTESEKLSADENELAALLADVLLKSGCVTGK